MLSLILKRKEEGTVNIWFTTLSCTMRKKDKHGACCHICRIPQIVIVSINTQRRVARVSDFSMLLIEHAFGENLKVKLSF